MGRDRSNKVKRGAVRHRFPDSPRSSLLAVLALRGSAATPALGPSFARSNGDKRCRTAMNDRTARLDRSRIWTLATVGLRNAVYVCARSSGGESHRHRTCGNGNRKNSFHASSFLPGPYPDTTVTNPNGIGVTHGPVSEEEDRR